MIKPAIFILGCCISLASFANTMACPGASATTSPGFCLSFKAAAKCYCTSSGIPGGMCSDMTKLYQRMISMFGTLQKACQYQKNTSTQECIDDWNCYRLGGKNSKGGLCSGTGKAC